MYVYIRTMSVFAVGFVLNNRALSPNFSVLILSCVCDSCAAIASTNTVFALPPKLSCSSLVSLLLVIVVGEG